MALTAAPSYAWPGMGKINQALVKRKDGNDDGSAPRELIGDLKTTPPGQWTEVGKAVAGIIMGDISGESAEGGKYKLPGALKTKKCKSDKCCVWGHVSNWLTTQFTAPDGQCNDYARASIRMGFHDAGTWAKSMAAQGQDFGGADGSIVLSKAEIKRPENKGLEEIVRKARDWAIIFGVGVADLVQFMAIHAVVTCPLGPRIRVFVGRMDSSRACPDGLLPGVTQPPDDLIALFEDKTIGPHDLAALLGAHSTSRQFFFNESHSGEPQDDTPGVWDVKFYGQTLQDGPDGVFKFQSDIALGNHPRVHDEWMSFAGPGGQDHWNEDYAIAYTRLSMLGVNNINSLTECTRVLPPAKKGSGGGNNSKAKGS
ncbi:heme peroxidase [Terfezia claveryi]|nr:heme peroxidase [Terfezia claveryi]